MQSVFAAVFVLNNEICKHVLGPQNLKVPPDRRTRDRIAVSLQSQVVIITTVPPVPLTVEFVRNSDSSRTTESILKSRLTSSMKAEEVKVLTLRAMHNDDWSQISYNVRLQKENDRHVHPLPHCIRIPNVHTSPEISDRMSMLLQPTIPSVQCWACGIGHDISGRSSMPKCHCRRLLLIGRRSKPAWYRSKLRLNCRSVIYDAGRRWTADARRVQQAAR